MARTSWPRLLGGALLILGNQPDLMGQIAVVNGLIHVHPVKQVNQGELVLINHSTDSAWVSLTMDSLLGQWRRLIIPSEWHLGPGERISLPYHWAGGDSAAMGTLVYAEGHEPLSILHKDGLTIHHSLRFAVSIYRGPVIPATDRNLSLSLDSQQVQLRNESNGFLVANLTLKNQAGRVISRHKASLTLPGAQRSWPLNNPEARSAWLIDSKGRSLAMELK